MRDEDVSRPMGDISRPMRDVSRPVRGVSRPNSMRDIFNNDINKDDVLQSTNVQRQPIPTLMRDVTQQILSQLIMRDISRPMPAATSAD
jgi:parvulin-like peptidyl-prolyl isomerase